MQREFIESRVIRLQPHYLWFLTLSYAMVIVLANWFDPRLISLFGLNTDAGTLIFPFTFLLSDLITEVYGYKHARQAIWCGFLFNALFVIYGQIIIHMPSPDYPTNNKYFDTLLNTNIRIIFASTISYLISEPLNSTMMAKLKIKMNGSYLGLRFVVSTIFGAGIDSFFFGILAFLGSLNYPNLFQLIIVMWLLKITIEIISLPLFIRLAKKLKKLEQLDIHDKKTKFNIFNFDTNYTTNDNEYGLNKEKIK